jgi:hypothetical protein
MKTIISFIFLLSFVSLHAQSVDHRELIQKTYLLSHIVFGSKSSTILEGLLAPKVSYGDLNGNSQTREEMIKSVSHNLSHYTDTAVSNIKVVIEENKNNAFVSYLFKAKEHKKDGSITALNFRIALVWIIVNGEWKLIGWRTLPVN